MTKTPVIHTTTTPRQIFKMIDRPIPHASNTPSILLIYKIREKIVDIQIKVINFIYTSYK